MAERYFEPWIGKNFDANRVLLLSESAYDWRDEDGEVLTPQPTHPSGSIRWNIEHFGKVQYFRKVNRALCMKRRPSADEMQLAWDDLAYTIFVQGSVGHGAGGRRTKEHWHSARHHFLALLEELRPLKVIVTGKAMWNAMPDCSVSLLKDLEAYELRDGQLVWCLALPHPANRSSGFKWQAIGESIRTFRATTFPSTRESAQLAGAALSP